MPLADITQIRRGEILWTQLFFGIFGTEPIQKFFALPLYLGCGGLLLFESSHNKDDSLNKPQKSQVFLCSVLKLSGGQQQRVAIARALASDAKVILADEPTGNLDEDTAADITVILKECAHQLGKCIVIVTHSGELAKQADVIFRLKKGEFTKE